MHLDETKLRRLVFIAQQRRARYLAMPLPTIPMIEADDPRCEAMQHAAYEAGLACSTALAELLNYLEDCLDMRSEFRV